MKTGLVVIAILFAVADMRSGIADVAAGPATPAATGAETASTWSAEVARPPCVTRPMAVATFALGDEETLAVTAMKRPTFYYPTEKCKPLAPQLQFKWLP